MKLTAIALIAEEILFFFSLEKEKIAAKAGNSSSKN